MNRRNFLGTMLAACAAPAIVRADSLMRIVPRETGILPWVDWSHDTLIYGGARGGGMVLSKEIMRAFIEHQHLMRNLVDPAAAKRDILTSMGHKAWIK